MSGFQKILKLSHLSVNDRYQRILLGTVLLMLNFWRTDWLSATVPDYLATAIQFELIITGALGWCPFIAYKLHRTKKLQSPQNK